MCTSRLFGVVVCLLLVVGGSISSYAQQNQTATRADGSSPVTLIAGTAVHVVLFEHVNSGLSTLGETVDMKVAGDVRVGNQVLIAKGARVKAQVGNVGRRGMMGKGGDISFSPVSVQAVDGQWVPLDKDQLGAHGAGASVGAIVGIGMWAKGRAAFVLRGQPFEVTVRRDTVINTTQVLPQPTLRRPDVQIAATVEQVDRINFAKGKAGEDIVFDIELVPEMASLVPRDSGAVQIVKVHEDVLYEPVKAMNVRRDPQKSNMLKAVFGWWSVIKYAQPGTTPIVLQCMLSDGRVAQAQVTLTSEWKLR